MACMQDRSSPPRCSSRLSWCASAVPARCALFPRVRAYRDSAPDASEPVGHIAFFASLSPLEFKAPLDGQFDSERTANFVKGIESWPLLEHVPPGPIVTDARNPLARLQIPIAEKHFEAMNEMIWLNWGCRFCALGAVRRSPCAPQRRRARKISLSATVRFLLRRRQSPPSSRGDGFSWLARCCFRTLLIPIPRSRMRC